MTADVALKIASNHDTYNGGLSDRGQNPFDASYLAKDTSRTANILYTLSGRRVFVAGETGMVGRAITRALTARGDVDVVSAPHAALDLTDQAATYAWLAENPPDVIFLTAGRVGGIGANDQYPADFIRDNMAIALNVIDGAHRAGIDRLVYFGSSCIYPRDCPQPIREEYLMTGPLEPTNEGYAIAKIAALKLCQFYRQQYGRRYISLMPTNLYGPGDKYDAENGHVIAAMIVKFKEAVGSGAKTVTLWGTGAPLREFLHVDDLARAAILLAERYDGDMPVNVGSGEEISIRDLAHVIAGMVGFRGDILFDPTKPDGTPRKLLECSKIGKMGWSCEKNLERGLSELLKEQTKLSQET